MTDASAPQLTLPPGFARLLERRSVASLIGPAPNDAEVDLLLRMATTVPDHGELRPWRFVVIRGEGRQVFGTALAAAAAEHDPTLPADKLEKTRGKPLIAPLVIALVFSPRDSFKVKEWEQTASAACTGYAIVLAAHLLELGAVWKSTPFTTGQALRDLFGFSDNERLMGWVNVGRPLNDPAARSRERIPVAEVATLLEGDGLQRFPRQPAPAA